MSLHHFFVPLFNNNNNSDITTTAAGKKRRIETHGDVTVALCTTYYGLIFILCLDMPYVCPSHSV